MSDILGNIEGPLGGIYDIEGEVGRGGTAIVYVAHDRKHDRRVAIKVLRPELSATLAADRFLREIRIAAGLNHPHILALYDSGSVHGYLYFVTPYVEGESLRARLNRESRLPILDAISIARDVASALAYSHAHGVVHRDIKPENILLHGDEAIVADFGIAHALQKAGEERLTHSGTAVGTLTYMAPEQAMGDVDARSDIYSLGCVLFESLAGHPPFRGRSTTATLAQHAREPIPRLSTLRPDVPPQLEDLVVRAMAKSPNDRFRTADALATALRAISAVYEVSGPQRRPWSRSLRSLRLPALVVGVGLAAIALTTMVMRRPPPLRPADLVIFPFRVQGSVDTSLITRDLLVELLHARLPGDGGLRALDPGTVAAALARERLALQPDPSPDRLRRVAARLGAGTMLLGQAIGTPHRLELSGQVYDVRSGATLTRLQVPGHADSVLTLVDRFAAELLVRSAGESSRRLDELTTSNLPALRMYLAGLLKYRRGRYEEASVDFERALQLDSAFALAALQLSTARALSGDNAGDTRALDVAWRHQDRLSRSDRLYLRLIVGPRYPNESSLASWIRAWQANIDTLPDRWEASWFFGDVVFHEGLAADVKDARILARNQLQRALRVDSALAPALEHLIELAVISGDGAEVDRLSSRYFAGNPEADNSLFVRWLVAAVHSDRATLAALHTASSNGSPAARRIVSVAQLVGLDLDGALSVSGGVERAASGSYESYEAQIVRRQLLINMGRPSEALSDSQPKATFPLPIEPFFRIVEGLYWDGDTVAAARAAEGRASSARLAMSSSPTRAIGPMLDVCAVGMWRLHRGDLTEIDAFSRTLRAFPQPYDRGGTTFIPLCAATLQARLDARLRRPGAPQSLAHLDSLVAEDLVTNGYIRLAAKATLAELWLEASDTLRALNAVRRRSYVWGPEGVVGLSTLLRTEGELAVLSRDTAGAIRAYEHYLALRARPEPRLRPQVDSVRAALQVLKDRARPR